MRRPHHHRRQHVAQLPVALRMWVRVWVLVGSRSRKLLWVLVVMLVVRVVLVATAASCCHRRSNSVCCPHVHKRCRRSTAAWRRRQL